MIRLLILMLFSMSVIADVQYSWDLPTQREDGSALDVSEISHFVIRYSTGGGPETDVSTQGATTGYLLVGGDYSTVAKVATVDASGRMGAFSDPCSATAPPAKIILRCEHVEQ